MPPLKNFKIPETNFHSVEVFYRKKYFEDILIVLSNSPLHLAKNRCSVFFWKKSMGHPPRQPAAPPLCFVKTWPPEAYVLLTLAGEALMKENRFLAKKKSRVAPIVGDRGPHRDRLVSMPGGGGSAKYAANPPCVLFRAVSPLATPRILWRDSRLFRNIFNAKLLQLILRHLPSIGVGTGAAIFRNPLECPSSILFVGRG